MLLIVINISKTNYLLINPHIYAQQKAPSK